MYKLLIVDDESIIRKGIMQLVNMETLSIHEVYEASNGVEALSIVKEKMPDIVLTDINMPHMDGLELAKAIKNIHRNIKVIVITGYDYFDYAVSALKVGVDDYILKPVSRKDIQELLHKITTKISEEVAKESSIKLLSALQTNLSNHTNSSKKTSTNNQVNLSMPDTSSDPLEYREAILQTIEAHFSDSEFSLVILAKTISLSSGYLSTLFKQIFGIPFQEYLLNQRMERSKILLLTTHMKVYEIAEKIGFEDANYFSVSFKKRYGKTPNQYRVNPKGDAKA